MCIGECVSTGVLTYLWVNNVSMCLACDHTHMEMCFCMACLCACICPYAHMFARDCVSQSVYVYMRTRYSVYEHRSVHFCGSPILTPCQPGTEMMAGGALHPLHMLMLSLWLPKSGRRHGIKHRHSGAKTKEWKHLKPQFPKLAAYQTGNKPGFVFFPARHRGRKVWSLGGSDRRADAEPGN